MTYPILRAFAKRYPRLSILHFDAHPDVYAAMGVSKEQYVLSRRRDDGLDKLSIVPAKK